MVARTAGALLMGLALTACPAADDGDDTAGTGNSSTSSYEPDPATNGGGASDYGGPVTEGWGSSSGAVDETSSSGDGSSGDSSSGGDSTGDASTGDASTGGSSTGIGEPDYGVPTTGE